jgi:hypothetical protein
MMKPTAPARSKKQRIAARRVVNKLLAAVEKSLAANDEVKQARDELARISVDQKQEATPCQR